MFLEISQFHIGEDSTEMLHEFVILSQTEIMIDLNEWTISQLDEIFCFMEINDTRQATQSQIMNDIILFVLLKIEHWKSILTRFLIVVNHIHIEAILHIYQYDILD